MKDKEANKFAIEKAQIEALIEKHRPHTPKTPDEVSRSGTGKNAKVMVKRGTKRKNPHIKRQQRISRLKSPTKREKKLKMPKKLGDPVANTATGIGKGQKDKIGINDIGIFEFIFHGLPEPPELEGIDEGRLRELQNAIQEQLHQRDEERERNITK